MKKLMIIILGLFIVLAVTAHDRTQFRYDFMNIEIEHNPKINTNYFQWKPTIIFVATFVAIQAVIIYDYRNGLRNTYWKTAPIFVAGMAGCLLTYKF